MNFSKKMIALMVSLFVFMSSAAMLAQATEPDESSKTSTSSKESSSKDTPSKESSSKPSSKPPSSKQPSSKEETSEKEKSSNANLSNLTVVRGAMTPAFNKNVTTYFVTITGGEGTPGVKPTAEDSNAKVSKNVPVLAMNGSATATVVVTAEDGVTKKTYTLNMNRVPGEESSSSEESASVESVIDVSTDYPSETQSIDTAALLSGTDSELSSLTSEPEQGRGSSWILYLGIVLIIGALGGIGFAIYRQFFSGPKGPRGGDYGYDDGYGDGYDNYDGYDDGYGDGYDDYGPDGYDDNNGGYGEYEGEDYSQYDNRGNGYDQNAGYTEGETDLYDDVTTYIPPAQRGGQQGYTQNQGYSRRPSRQDSYDQGGRRPSGQSGRNPNQGGGRSSGQGGQGQYRRGSGGGQPPRNPNQGRYRPNNDGYSNFEDDR